MIVIPAVDIRHGRAVRLIQGDAGREIAYGDDPVRVAARWVEQGARWLHVVDLDGAFRGRPAHLDLVRAICGLGVPVQTGGGIRTLADVEAALAAGARRVILGTAALRLAGEVAHLGDRIAASVDARDGRVTTEGWTADAGLDAIGAARALEALGIPRVIHTSVGRDGTLAGPDLEALRGFVAAVRTPVIAAGGVASRADLAALERVGVEGAIVGRALYEGAVTLC